jgi:hypothetical protein
MISGFRFGFLGESDIGNTNEAVIAPRGRRRPAQLLLGFVAYRLLRSGWKLKSLSPRATGSTAPKYRAASFSWPPL